MIDHTQRIEIIPPENVIWGKPGVDPDLAPNRLRNVTDIVGCVIHTTGYGPGVKATDDKYGRDEAAIAASFAKRQASNLQYKPHVLIGRDGSLWQMVPLAYAALHTGGGHRAVYAKPGWAKTAEKPTLKLLWWHSRFPALDSPLDLDFWRPHAQGINGRSWGVDLLAPRPGESFTPAQYGALATLVAHVALSVNHAIDSLHVLDHAAVNPIDRSNAHGAWDLGGDFQWDHFRMLLNAEWAARVARLRERA